MVKTPRSDMKYKQLFTLIGRKKRPTNLKICKIVKLIRSIKELSPSFFTLFVKSEGAILQKTSLQNLWRWRLKKTEGTPWTETSIRAKTRSKEKKKTPPLIYYIKQRGNIGKKPYLTTFKGGGHPNMKNTKYWGATHRNFEPTWL